MYCTQCGNLCSDQDKVCTRCGNHVNRKKNEVYQEADNSSRYYGTSGDSSSQNDTQQNDNAHAYNKAHTYNPNGNYHTNYQYANRNYYAVPYAGFWLRFAARLIDGIIINIGTWVLYGILSVVLGASIYSLNSVDSGIGVVMVLLMQGIVIASAWLYSALFESSVYQATPGKMAVGIKVVDLEGNQLTFGRATGRYFATVITGLTLGIGYIMAGFTEKKQALHDMIAGTLVIRK